MTSFKRPLRFLAVLAAGTLLLSACENTGSGSSGAYYDSMMWNDYYYRPYPPRPDRPPRPEHPIERPPERPVHPIAPRPPVSRPTPAPRPTPRPAPRPSPRR